MNSLVLVDTNGILPNLVESQVSLQALEEENMAAANNSLRRPSLAFTNGSDSIDMNLNPQSSNDSLSVLRPRLPTIIDEFKDYNVQDMIDDRATLSRSSSRNVGIEIKMKGLGFSVICSKGDHLQQEVKTVYNQSFPYKLFRFFQRKWIRIFNTDKDLETTTQLEERFILKDINLYLKPGKNYLILGPPSSGKTSLLNALAGLVEKSSLSLHGHVSSTHKGEPIFIQQEDLLFPHVSLSFNYLIYAIFASFIHNVCFSLAYRGRNIANVCNT
jgi:ABC-type multidrug transport system fused ATPase/permease subunit